MSKIPNIVPDFSAYPDLVVIYLGMQVRKLSGVKTALSFGFPIDRAGNARPDGLLYFENKIIYSLFPLNVGTRWYWRDMDSLTAWAKSEPHRAWWKEYMQDAHGVATWHESYHMRGGMEAIYMDTIKPTGFAAFLPMQEARGSMASRHRAHASSDLSSLPRENPPGPAISN